MTQVARGWGWCGAARRLGLLLLLPVLAGCGSGKGTVSGKVIYQGKGLPGGRVTFRPADPRLNPVGVVLDAEGHYEVSLPPGEVVISVDNRELDPAAARAAPPPQLPPGIKLPRVPKPEAGPAEVSPNTIQNLPGRYRGIPPKFYSTDTSGLKYTVQKGSQTHDIDLK